MAPGCLQASSVNDAAPKARYCGGTCPCREAAAGAGRRARATSNHPGRETSANNVNIVQQAVGDKSVGAEDSTQLIREVCADLRMAFSWIG